MLKLKLLIISFLLSSCSSLSNITDSFSDFIADEEILFLSSYENVKIVDQDSNLTGQNSHPVNVSEERIEGALKLLLFRVGKKTNSLFPEKS